MKNVQLFDTWPQCLRGTAETYWQQECDKVFNVDSPPQKTDAVFEQILQSFFVQYFNTPFPRDTIYRKFITGWKAPPGQPREKHRMRFEEILASAEDLPGQIPKPSDNQKKEWFFATQPSVYQHDFSANHMTFDNVTLLDMVNFFQSKLNEDISEGKVKLIEKASAEKETKKAAKESGKL